MVIIDDDKKEEDESTQLTQRKVNRQRQPTPDSQS